MNNVTVKECNSKREYNSNRECNS